MAKSDCPAGCGKRFVSAEHAEKHADAYHPDWRTPKSKGWLTPYGFSDWSEPITYEEACENMKAITEAVKSARA